MTLAEPTIEQVRVRVLPDGRLARKEAAKYLGISWRYLDEIKCKELDSAKKKLVRYINHGKRVLFPIDELRRFNEQLKRQQWQESS